jgi:hypothetical protein
MQPHEVPSPTFPFPCFSLSLPHIPLLLALFLHHYSLHHYFLPSSSLSPAPLILRFPSLFLLVPSSLSLRLSHFNRMRWYCRCRKCRKEFCWICMQDWSLHGDETGGYFQCNKFGDGEKERRGEEIVAIWLKKTPPSSQALVGATALATQSSTRGTEAPTRRRGA